MNILILFGQILILTCVYGIPLLSPRQFNNFNNEIHFYKQEDEQQFDYLNFDEDIGKEHFEKVFKDFDSFLIGAYNQHSLYKVD